MIRVFSETDKTFTTNGDIIIEPFKSKVINKLNDSYSYEVKILSIENTADDETDRISSY